MMKLEYAILIVTHNHERFLHNLINSLTKYGYTNTFFCDAASSDRSASIIKESIYKNNLLEKKTLESFSKNNNDLLSHFNINAKYILFLNPDTYFDQDIIKDFIQTMESNKEIGLVCPLIKNFDNSIQYSVRRYPNLWEVIKRRMGANIKYNCEDVYESKSKIIDIDWCIGAAMFVRKALFSGDYVLDERYRLYCEDSDLCFSIQHLGSRTILNKNIIIFHYLHENSNKKGISRYRLLNVESNIKFILKWNIQYIFRKAA